MNPATEIKVSRGSIMRARARRLRTSGDAGLLTRLKIELCEAQAAVLECLTGERPLDAAADMQVDIPFAFTIDETAATVELLSGRNDTRLLLPLSDVSLLTAVLQSIDRTPSEPERASLDPTS